MNPDIVLKRPFYENCTVRNKDGIVIFHSSVKRAKWYVNKGLAIVLCEDPYEVQLTFDTNGMGCAGDPYYMQKRYNICVVCNADSNLTRHHIVPYGYRHYFPREKKDHSYHDVLLLCAEDHDLYERQAQILKTKIAHQYDAPINGIYDMSKEDIVLYHAFRNALHTLQHYGDKIPEHKRQELLDKIEEGKTKFGITEEELSIRRHAKTNVKTHGEIVISKLEDIDAFVQMWREHFVSTMEPKFLPEHWSVDRKHR